MYTIALTFSANNDLEIEEKVDTINFLLGAWRMNGQIFGDQFPTARIENGYSVYVITPEVDSVSDKYQNKYVKKYCDSLLDVGLCRPVVTVVGREPDCVNACSCANTEFYILYTTFATLESPLRCGHCFGFIPLYKIPKTYEDEYYDIISWQSDYQSCDSLQMNCSVGERFATNQMGSIDSSLSRMGIDSCNSISSKTGKPVYYYLYKGSGKSHKIELSRRCPKCGGDWHRAEALHGIFDFMCIQCCLLSNIAWNVQ